MIREIVLIIAQYPTKDDPVYAFIRPVAQGLADLGIHMSIIAPQSITNTIKRRVKIRPHHWIDYSTGGKSIDIYQPCYFSLSMLKVHDKPISLVFFRNAIVKEFNRLKKRPDLVYAHFWESVVAASEALGDGDIPLIAVSGEERVSVFDGFPKEKVIEAKQKVKGLICVSTKNYEECVGLDLVHSGMKTVILPNAVNTEVYYKSDKHEARQKLNWSNDETIAIYVGEFSKRKGVNRLIEAAKKNPRLKLVLIGSGDQLMETDQIIYCGRVSHDDIPLYLNAADFFVLPTLAEGCCNAIVEALACGLPIISSDRSFNYDILDGENSILVDPEKIDEIADAMKLLAENTELREKLSVGALKKSKELDIETRVKKIKDFLETVVQNDSAKALNNKE